MSIISLKCSHTIALHMCTKCTLFTLFFIIIQFNFLTCTLVQQLRSNPSHHTHAGNSPPAESNHAPVQAHTVPPSTDNGTHGTETRRDGLSQTVNGSQDGRVGGAVVEQDNAGRQGHGAGRGVQKQNHHDREPQRRRDGSGAILVLRLGQDRQERSEQVRHGEDDQKVAEAAQGSQTGMHGRVHDDLQQHAQNTEDGGRVADSRSRHAQTACEPEEVSLGDSARLNSDSSGLDSRNSRRRESRAGRGQEQSPDVGEGAEVEIVEGLAEQGEDDVLGPQTAEGKRPLLAALGGGRRGLLLVELDGLNLFVPVVRVVDVVQGSAQEEALDARCGVKTHVIGSLLGFGGLYFCESRISKPLVRF